MGDTPAWAIKTHLASMSFLDAGERASLRADPRRDARDPGRAVRLVKRFDSRVEIEFLRIAEGILYYREKRGSAEVSTASQLKSAVQRRFPDLALRELSPRPVLAGENPW